MQQRQPIDPSKLKVINPGDFVTFELVNGSCFSGVIKEIGKFKFDYWWPSPSTFQPEDIHRIKFHERKDETKLLYVLIKFSNEDLLDAIVYSSFDLAKQNFFDYTGVTYEKFEKRLSAGEDYEEILGYKYAGTLIKTRQILSV